MKHLIAPSLLSADFSNLGKDVEMINQSSADWIHFDIMDGVFVPNISFGFPVLEAVHKIAQKPLDVHLMIVQPEKFINEFKKLGTYMLTVHYEACTHLHRTIQQIKQAGMKAGVALNPHTPTNLLSEIITDVDMILIMSVNPGFGGQKFIENSYRRISEVRNMIERTNSEALIEVDGGVGTDNAHQLYEAGVNVLVSGNSIFKSKNPIKTIQELRNA